MKTETHIFALNRVRFVCRIVEHVDRIVFHTDCVHITNPSFDIRLGWALLRDWLDELKERYADDWRPIETPEFDALIASLRDEDEDG